ncbi:hypothetical protein Vretimale_8192 [Volvox reticuliferus]|uniref:Uncharacterized protein n=1 Tax=Volvox reticuliferus TaxID=1737510 RepID=A0A8J4GBA6_9CHLO|nr:hypothetical protein Vretifemale_11750 [Volvox reticuliferus]GIM03656.1 hypothetical protein Vretimale_8192 [Volvox reticuliferus]
MAHDNCLGGLTRCRGARTSVDCQVCRPWRSVANTRRAFLAACLYVCESSKRFSLIAGAGSSSAVSPNSRRRTSRQLDPPARWTQLSQTELSEPNGRGGGANAPTARSIAGSLSERPHSGTNAIAQKPAAKTPALPPPPPVPKSYRLSYSAAAIPDLDQLSGMVPAVSLDDILSGKPVPPNLTTGTPGDSDGSNTIASTSAELSNALAARVSQPIPDRHNLTSLRRRALRPWDRPTVYREVVVPASQLDPEPAPATLPPALAPAKHPGPASRPAPAAARHESSTVQMPAAANNSELLSTSTPSPLLVGTYEGPADQTGPLLQNDPPAGPLVVPAVRQAEALTPELESSMTPMTAATAKPGVSARPTTGGSRDLLPRPVRAQPGGSSASFTPQPSVPSGPQAGTLGSTPALPASPMALASLNLGGTAPLLNTTCTAAAVEPVTELVVRSTRAPRAARVRSKEWLAARQAVEAAAAAVPASSGTAGSGAAWDKNHRRDADGNRVTQPAYPGAGNSGQAADPEAVWGPSRIVAAASSTSRRIVAGSAAPEIQPEVVSEPRRVLVLHEAPLRDAFEAATAAPFPLPSRQQLPDAVVDRHSWRLHAAVLFPHMYDADWHSCLFDFLFELWPEVGRAHVTAAGSSGSRRLLLTSEVELTEALAADAAGVAAPTPLTPPPSPARVQRAAQLLEDAYTFVARCFSSADFAIRSAAVVSVLDCLGDHDELVENLALRLPPLMVQRLLVPLAPRFQPPWVVEEWLNAVADAYPDYVPVATVPRRWQELMEQLAAAEVVHPGGGLGVVHAVLEFAEEGSRRCQRPVPCEEASTSPRAEGHAETPLSPRQHQRTRAHTPESSAAGILNTAEPSGDGNSGGCAADGVNGGKAAAMGSHAGDLNKKSGTRRRQESNGTRSKMKGPGTPDSGGSPFVGEQTQQRRRGRRKAASATSDMHNLHG